METDGRTDGVTEVIVLPTQSVNKDAAVVCQRMCLRMPTDRHHRHHAAAAAAAAGGGGGMYVDARWYKVTRNGLYATFSSLLSAPFIAVGVLLIVDIWNVGSAAHQGRF